ncbi:hypothetical protein [Flavivirga eckloniae]|uniref:Lipoprotein n=1 Tax=Flavivirga eckloniae TaxID=1803846 RepID=A0A2K9PRK0_9FLAO|nr:hypothetical protein [Flavivirga eckloniae]AUP79692.1 hypothetical protein C1H87_13635 [Flavivirga eckloniae]
MLKPFLFVCFVFCILQGCKTIDIRQTSQTNTTQQVVLGSIGLGKDFLLQNEFNNTAIPNYKTSLKVAVKVVPFNKQTYKSFIKAKALQPANVKIHYVDSIKNKPKYVKLQIADKVAVIDALNNTENTSVKKYLSNNTNATVLTSISLALNQNNLDALTHADAVFLIEKGLKTYVLKLYKDGKQTQFIQFNQGVVFTYKTSNCCWQENKKHQVDIVDLVTEFNSCPNKTYRSAKRAEKKMSTLNF